MVTRDEGNPEWYGLAIWCYITHSESTGNHHCPHPRLGPTTLEINFFVPHLWYRDVIHHGGLVTYWPHLPQEMQLDQSSPRCR